MRERGEERSKVDTKKREESRAPFIFFAFRKMTPEETVKRENGEKKIQKKQKKKKKVEERNAIPKCRLSLSHTSTQKQRQMRRRPKKKPRKPKLR